MKSSIPKHLHPVAGMPIVERVIRAGLAIDPGQIVTVVSPELADLPSRLGMEGEFETVIQVVADGTAGAVRTALDHLQPVTWLVSLLGDSPLLTGEAVHRLVTHASESGARVTILTCTVPDGQSYGRIERDEHHNACRIVELKNDDLSKRQGPIEINSGIMVLDAAWAREALSRIQQSADAGNEYLLTDILEVAIEGMSEGDPWPIATVEASEEVAHGINDRRQQATADEIVRRQVRQRLLTSGVTLIGPDTIFIDDTVEIASDTTILPFSVITGRTVIGSGCQIGPHAVLHDAVIADRVELRSSTVTGSSVREGTRVGPYAHLRGNTRVGPNVHVGTSAELKNSSVGDGSNVAHFSYIGDTTIGEHTNIGAGTITANYDGKAKHPTTIGDNVFIGSDSVLIAPVTVGDGAKTGAGAVVNRDVAPGATVVGVPARAIGSRRTAAPAANEE
jgi:bifunctional UDP-N-acetylglucosamine pyrophosphorylase/glucosamine-1-phosphate N-acetyltransferase